MTWFGELYRSAVAKKAVMAISGIVLFGFVLGHMTGNLKVFQGPEKFNAYSEWLREIGYPLLPHGGALWLARVVLLLAVGLHIWSAAELTRMSRRARPERHARRRGLQLDYAARTMRWSGVLIGFYVVYHLMAPHFRQHASRFRCRGRLSQSGLRLRVVADRDALHREQRAPRLSPLPWSLEHVSVSRMERLRLRRLAATLRGHVFDSRGGRFYLRPGGGHDPLSVIAEEPMAFDPKVPAGSLEHKWLSHRDHLMLVAPANRRKFQVVVVGTGLAGASAAATLGEAGYRVKAFTFHDSPRRAHSIAAQGGINAAKNYRNDGDSAFRLFYDTIKGGDFRSREANVYRLAELSVEIIDQAVAQGVPFAREYGGLLDNRSFGGAQVARTFYARGQTGQQLLLGAYQAMARQIEAGTVELYPRTEMLDLVVDGGRARGVVARNLVTGEVSSHAAHAVVLATGGSSNVYYLSTNAKASNVTAIWRAYRRGAFFANPCFTQIHPTCIPSSGEFQSKLTLMSESLRNDGRIWVPKDAADTRPASEIPESDRDYYLETKYPAFGNSSPEMSPRGMRMWSSMRGAESVLGRTGSSSTSKTLSSGQGGKRSKPAMAISSRCTSGSPRRIPTRCPCASSRPPTTPWEACGSITI